MKQISKLNYSRLYLKIKKYLIIYTVNHIRKQMQQNKKQESISLSFNQSRNIRIPKDLISYLEDKKTKRGFSSIAQMIAQEYRQEMIRQQQQKLEESQIEEN